MAKVQNTFLKSKMNKDLDARIIPNGEYRDAFNIAINKSEDAEVGNIQNVLGNELIFDFENITNVSGLKCIGSFSDEVNSTIYFYFTDNTTSSYIPTGVGSNHYVVSYNTLAPSNSAATILVTGNFLNFSTQFPITAINVLETLLFWTDNRNQPRVIDIELANQTQTSSPNYYSNEDQISVAKYNPYKCIQLFEKSALDANEYETTMRDVSSKFLPNGGSAIAINLTFTGFPPSVTIPANTDIDINSLNGEIVTGPPYNTGATVALLNTNDQSITVQPGIQVSFYNAATSIIRLNQDITLTESTKTFIFNPNPYYNPNFGGDPDFLEDKFVRFAYRYRFEDNTYSIFSPFTQTAFIPKQDGYFMYVDESQGVVKEDQSEAYRTSVVYFVENKVNSIDLKIPLPFSNYTLQEALKIQEIDILYKESDSLAVRVVETIKVDKITNSSAVCLTNNPTVPSDTIPVDAVRGGIKIGETVVGAGIPDGTVVASPGFTPTDPSNPIAGTIKLSNSIAQLDDNTILTIGDPNFFEYSYLSSKPTKTLPESELIRVFDKVPVKALAQEISGNRVIYGNFLNKIDPPASIDYNVACTEKFSFELNEHTASYISSAATTIPAGTSISVTIGKPAGDEPLFVGSIVTCNDYGSFIPEGTVLTSTTSNVPGPANMTFSNDITVPIGNVLFIFDVGGNVSDYTSLVEYPSSSVKTNRNYQIGFVLSDRYGRQSSVILTENEDEKTINNISYIGSTLYSPYLSTATNTSTWRGNSLKVLVNSPIIGNLYNGNTNDVNYNPLGWYSYKIVVKQTEQEYYNVYLPGIMAAYPSDQTKELGLTSHIALLNDNINKIPRDLTEVGPEQRQFRSSIQLYGRVENTNVLITSSNISAANKQYYPGRDSSTATVISTVQDLFDYNPINPPAPNYFPQFYDVESNPLIARIGTQTQIGQISTTDYRPGTGIVSQSTDTTASPGGSSVITVRSVSGSISSITGYLISGPGIPEETYIGGVTTTTHASGGNEYSINLVDDAGLPVFVVVQAQDLSATPPIEDADVVSWVPASGLPNNRKLDKPGLQYLAVYETEPVVSAIDIFWETSSTGLISDLNSLIINNQTDPGGQKIGPWNPLPFDENLAEQGNILAAPFNLIDNFGDIITLNAALGDSLEIHDVVDGFGNSVNQNVFDSVTSFRKYFELYDTGGLGNGPWQIRTTNEADTDPAPNGAYWPNVFYFADDPATPGTNNLRNFKFIFKVTQHTTDPDGNPIVLETFPGESGELYEANLGNVNPVVYLLETFQTDVSPNDQFGELPGIPVPDPTLIITDRQEANIGKIQVTNGAANKTPANGPLQNQTNYLSNRDVDFIDNGNGTGIFSQTIANTGEPAEINGSPIFELIDDNSGPDFALCKIIKNTQSSNAQMQAVDYSVQLRIQDGGGITNVNLTIDMSGKIIKEYVFNRTMYARASRTGNTIQPSNQDYANYGFPGGAGNFTGFRKYYNFPNTLINIPPGTPGFGGGNDGCYVYAGGFFNEDLQAVQNKNPGSKSLISYVGGNNINIYKNSLAPASDPNMAGRVVQTNEGPGLISSSSIHRPYGPFVKGFAYVIDIVRPHPSADIDYIVIGSQSGTVANPGSPTGFDDPNYVGDNGIPGYWANTLGPLLPGMRCYIGATGDEFPEWTSQALECCFSDNSLISASCCLGMKFGARVKSYDPSNGHLKMGSMAGDSNYTFGGKQVQVGDKLNFFNGPLRANTNPWFHGDTMPEVMGMYLWSEWGPGYWDRWGIPVNRFISATGQPDQQTAGNSFLRGTERIGYGQPSCLYGTALEPVQPMNYNQDVAYHEVPGETFFEPGEYNFTIY